MRFSDNSLKIRANNASLNPELIISFSISKLDAEETPISITGTIFSDDDKKIATITENIPSYTNNQTYELKIIPSNNRRSIEVTYQISVEINQKILEHLENRRTKNRNHDVILNLKLAFSYLITRARLQTMVVSSAKGSLTNSKEEVFLIGYNIREIPGTNHFNVLGIDTDSAIISSQIFTKDLSYTIASSDWIHQFAPVLNIGKFLVIDYPVIEALPGSMFQQSTNKSNEKGDNTGLFLDKYNKAVNAIPKMHEKLLQGDWYSVIEESRPIYELIRDLKDSVDLKNLFIRNGFTEEAYKDFNDGIKSLFDFSSKFHHTIAMDKKTLLGTIIPNQEDGYLVYTLSLSVMHSIASKIKRVGI